MVAIVFDYRVMKAPLKLIQRGVDELSAGTRLKMVVKRRRRGTRVERLHDFTRC